MTRYFIALYERRHWIVESSVLMGLHPDVNPAATPAQLAEVYELWLVYKRERKRRSDTLRSLVVAVYDQLYSAVTQKLGDEPAPLVDAEVYFDPSVPHYSPVNLSWVPSGRDWVQCAHDVDLAEPWRAWWLTDPAVHPYNTCFRARNVDFLVFAPRGMDPQVVDDAIEEDFDLAEQAPPAYAPGAPPRLNRQGIHIFTGSSIGELGSDGESARVRLMTTRRTIGWVLPISEARLRVCLCSAPHSPVERILSTLPPRRILRHLIRHQLRWLARR